MISWRQGLLATIVFELASADTAETNIPQCAMKGVSYSDPNIQTLNGGQPPDAMTCQKACAFTASCLHFTYYTDSKGCWLMTEQAELNKKGDVPSEIFAVSGPKVCPPMNSKKASTNTGSEFQPPEELHPDTEGHVTIAPGVEISPTGPRPVPVLGSSMNETFLNISNASAGWEVPYTGVKVPATILGLHWSWWCLIVASACLLCCCFVYCCCCCCSSSPRRKKRAIEAEVLKQTEQEPLVPARPLKDAGLFRPQLHVPQLPMPQLVTPQLVSLPASQAQANARAMELHISPIISPRSSAGSPTHFVKQMV